ncbi:hypothetical protein EON65_13185, partial [archaeon]
MVSLCIVLILYVGIRFLQAPANHDLRIILAVGDYDEVREVLHTICERVEGLGVKVGMVCDGYGCGDDPNTHATQAEQRAVHAGIPTQGTWYMRHRDGVGV